MLFSKLIDILIAWPRDVKKIIVLFIDIFFCFFASWAAFCLRYDEFLLITNSITLSAILSILLFAPIFFGFGLYKVVYRFSGLFVIKLIMRAIFIYAILYFLLILLLGNYGVPKSIGIIQPILLFFMVVSFRLLAKYFFSKFINGSKNINNKPSVLIYGAGSAGRQLASGLKQGFEINLIGFIDDNSELNGCLVLGLPVFGPAQINELIRSKQISEILLAIPSLSKNRQREILSKLSDLPVHVRTLPGLSHLATGAVTINDVRDVEVDDLLGRELNQSDIKLMSQNIMGKVVFVSGAGGSIGSELCKQIIANNPKILILFESSEFALYTVEREISELNSTTKVIPILGSVLDSQRLDRIMNKFNVETIYHAAAYKHVPMIEMNPAIGVLNNVFGTLRIVESACKSGVETFVLISTDKAVRPTNVMGCSKRLAELILQAKSLQDFHKNLTSTKLTMVRFGNVLGSSGSVLPVFRNQIKSGGPVTVTHPEIVRYFMTIPEAAQLVIQAGALGCGGDVMLLDMGEPVKILDLAKRMIHLSGFSYESEGSYDKSIDIVFTGLRQGEKLYEELLIGNDISLTSHPRIFRGVEDCLSWDDLESILLDLNIAISSDDSDKIRFLLKKAVPEANFISDNSDVLIC